MTVLDIDKIFAEIKKIKEGKESRDNLKALLGGKELEEVFDEQTITKLQENLVETNKVHKLLEEQEGFEVLEGLLNKKITGNLGKFYNIKPEYILGLEPEEQSKLAHTFAEGEPELEELLKKLWSEKIRTNACAGEKDEAYLYVTFPKNDINNISRMAEVSQNTKAKVDITTYEDDISITLYGKKPDLYKDLLSEFDKEVVPNEFISKLMTSLEFEKEIVEARTRVESGGEYTEDEVEEIVTNTAKELDEQHQDEIKKLQDEQEKLQQKYNKLYETHGRLKNFVVHKIGKIPFLGRRILKMMENEVKALPEGNSKVGNDEVDTGR